MTTKQQRLKEALERCLSLNLTGWHNDDLRKGMLWVSTPVDICGTLAGRSHAMTVGEAKVIKPALNWLWQLDIDALPYHCILNDAEFADHKIYRVATLLYVSSDNYKWTGERPLRQDDDTYLVRAAQWVEGTPELSDLQLVRISAAAGGLVRIN